MLKRFCICAEREGKHVHVSDDCKCLYVDDVWFLPRDAMCKCGLCCHPLCVRHVGELYPDS